MLQRHRIIAAAALAAAPLPAQITPAQEDALDRFLRRSRAVHGLPGLAVSIATRDSVVYALGLGATDAGDPITADTPFLIGSVSKAITATAIARLAAAGQLDLNAPVETWLPDFTMRRPFAPRSVTARHLLRHRSGFSQWSGHDRRAQATGEVSRIAPRGRPDSRAEYSSLNYIVLGRVLASVAGTGYDEHVRSALFEPLGMSAAFVFDSASERRPRGHQSWFGFQVARAEPTPPAFLVPAGFVAASANDLGRYGGALVGRGSFAGRRVLDSAAVAMILDESAPLGWGRSRLDDGALYFEHAGNARTSSARVRLVPARGYAITVLASTNSGPFMPATGDVMTGVQRIMMGKPEPNVFPRERLLKGAIGVGTVLSVLQLGRRTRDWGRAGTPVRLSSNGRVLGPLALDLALGTFVLVGVPRYIGVPLHTMVEYFPDLGVALSLSAGAGMVGGVLHAMTRSR